MFNWKQMDGMTHIGRNSPCSAAEFNQVLDILTILSLQETKRKHLDLVFSENLGLVVVSLHFGAFCFWICLDCLPSIFFKIDLFLCSYFFFPFHHLHYYLLHPSCHSSQKTNLCQNKNQIELRGDVRILTIPSSRMLEFLHVLCDYQACALLLYLK